MEPNHNPMETCSRDQLERICHLDSLRLDNELELLKRIIHLDATDLVQHVRAEHLTETQKASIPEIWQSRIVSSHPQRPRRDPILYTTGYMRDVLRLEHNGVSVFICNESPARTHVEVHVYLSQPMYVTYASPSRTRVTEARLRNQTLYGPPNVDLRIWLSDSLQ